NRRETQIGQETVCYKIHAARNHAAPEASNRLLQAWFGGSRSRSGRQRLGMQGQGLEGRERLHGSADGGKSIGGRADELDRLEEALQAQAAHASGQAACREDVVGAR